MSNFEIVYSPTNLSRVNPQFVGIAGTYSSHKRKRVISQRERNHISSNYNYMAKLNEEMDKNLQSKKNQLLRLQKVRQRHNNDVKNKMEEDERKRRELQELRRKSTEQRNSIRNGIKNASNMVKTQRENDKRQVKEQLYEYSVELRHKRDLQQTENSLRHKSIETDKRLGNQRVNIYYRKKNKKSLDNYLSLMNQEDSKNENNHKQVKRMNESIKKFKRQVSEKQEKLKNLMDEISFYSIESQHERKANLLANSELFRNIKTSSSFRSTPSQLLMPKQSKEK